MQRALLLFFFVCIVCVSAIRPIGCGTRCGEHHRIAEASRPGIQNCTEHFYRQTVDHFSYGLPSGGNYWFNQRYYICDPYWQKNATYSGPIFFYTGNEGDVTLYINNTGLMWESAPSFGALLIFAEHRYYGVSLPFGNETADNMWYLSSEQALADYAELLYFLKGKLNAEDSPVISFGGSYGGMLSSWFRMKYPSAVDGAIAASAPIMAFLGENPPTDPWAFNHIISRDATPYAKAAPKCEDNVRKAWSVLFNMSETAAGRNKLRQAWNLCPPAIFNGDVIANWAISGLGYMAMGNYPYPSSYMTNGDGYLPAFPMRVGCEYLAGDFSDDEDGQVALMEAMSKMVGIFYNATGTATCNNLFASVNAQTQYDDNAWYFQWCTELMMPQSMNGTSDMFFPSYFDLQANVKQCQTTWNVTSRPLWATIQYGAWNIKSHSNIVFSNGDYDPWSGSGVTVDVSDSVVAIVISESAHHLDLFWSHENDPESVRIARNTERQYIKLWVDQARQQKQFQTQ